MLALNPCMTWTFLGVISTTLPALLWEEGGAEGGGENSTTGAPRGSIGEDWECRCLLVLRPVAL